MVYQISLIVNSLLKFNPYSNIWHNVHINFIKINSKDKKHTGHSLVIIKGQ